MKHNIVYPRQDSLVSPIVENPFVHRLEWTIFDYVKITLMSITIAPLRLLFMGICLLSAWPLAAIAIAFRSEAERAKPMTGWRKAINRPVIFIGRLIFFLVGFQNVKLKGHRAPVVEAPILCVAPHSSYFDAILYFLGEQLASPVSKKENGAMLMMGSMYLAESCDIEYLE